MAEDNNTSEVKEMENFSPPAMSEEGSVEKVLVKDVGPVEDVVISVASKDQEVCISETNEVPAPKPPSVNSRRHSTGAVSTRAGKPQVKSRYRGDHHVSSIHDQCKHGPHGKRCGHEDVVKPWKMVRRKSVEAVKVETSGLRRRSLASVSKQIPGTKPDSSVAAKRDALPVKREPCASVDGSSVKSNDKAPKNKGTVSTLSGSAVVRKVPGLGNEKSNSAMKKVSRISDAEGSKVSAPKSLKEKAKTPTISGEDVKEKTVRVIEASVKGVQSEKQASSEKKTMSSGHKSLTKKKESGDAERGTDQTPEKKIRPKRLSGVKMNMPNQLSFKKGKTLEPKPEDSSPKWIKFRKKVVPELKTQTEGRKKKLKGIETKSESSEGSKREKVVLRHQNAEGKKKMMTLFNNVIEETMNKLTKVRKTKVKALIGAFETVISLQDTKTPQKVQSKATTSASKVSPLGGQQ